MRFTEDASLKSQQNEKVKQQSNWTIKCPETEKKTDNKKSLADNPRGQLQQQQHSQKRSSYYLIKPTCLIIFVVLLVSQLRAIELPTKSRRENVNSAPKSAVESTVESSGAQAHRPAGHDDFVTLNYNDRTRRHDAAFGAPSTDKLEPLEVSATVAQPQQVAITTADARAHEQPSTENSASPLVASLLPVVGAGASTVAAAQSPIVAQPSPSLAEMTAAGTAAGLLFHDLLTQANMQLDQNEAYQQPGMFNGMQSIGREMAELGEVGGLSRAGSGGNEDDDDEEAQALDEDRSESPNGHHTHDQVRGSNSMERPENSRVFHDGQGNGASIDPSEPVHAAGGQRVGVSDGTLAVNEDQMPDSMESLIKSEGESYSEPDGEGQQSAADSNLVNQAPAVPVQLEGAPNAIDDTSGPGEGDDDDEDDRQEENLLISPNTNQESTVWPQALASLPNAASPLIDPTGVALLKNGALLEGSGLTTGQNPMSHPSIRDSRIDLNTAAGHYYGKKKKKKKVKKVKKKVIIKKKKKKKKKYKKVKIYKVKKYKKKKPKKMMHHDHGKYYMYAKVPKKKTWEFGFKKGNKKHWIERHEKGHKNKFKTKVKWYDKKSKGKGIHIWDYNHYDKKKKKHH